MPTNKEELPDTIKRSADKIQRTYKKTLDSAHDQYNDEARAHQTAWSAVKQIAEKRGERWVLKDSSGPSDSRSEQSSASKRQGKGETYGGVDIKGNSREQLVQRARRAGITNYSHMNKRELAQELARKE